MLTEPNKKIRLSNNQISSILGTEAVILNHSEGIYYGLNEVGAFVWDNLKQNAATLNELKQQVLDTFEVDAETINNDLNDLIINLFNEKLVEFVE